MSQQDDLLRNLNKTLAELRKDVNRTTEATKTVAKFVKETGKENTKAVGQLRRVLLEMEISEKMSSIDAKRALVEDVEITLHEIKEEHADEKERLEERFEERIQRTNSLLEERVRRVGSHIYKTVEAGDEVEERFGAGINGFLATLGEKTVETFGDKWATVKERYDRILKRVGNFRRSRDEMVEDIETSLHRRPLGEPQFLEAEVWCVELRDEEGRARYAFVGPSAIRADGNRLLRPRDRLEALTEALENPFTTETDPGTDRKADAEAAVVEPLARVADVDEDSVRRFRRAHQGHVVGLLEGVNRPGS